MRDKELCEYEGKLALHLGTRQDIDNPVVTTTYLVSNIPARDWQHLLGTVPFFPNGIGYAGWVHPAGSWTDTIIDVHDWQVVEVTTPIPKPRDGKEYTWTYSLYKWRKDWFPKCPECREWHNPAFTYCENCGHCHKPGARCK